MQKKFMTRLLNADYRKRILLSMSEKKIVEYKIRQYARYTVDKCIIGRNKEHENDKDWAYGFSPLEVLAYVAKDGKLNTMLCEFNTVNHFLKNKDGDTAVEVVTCVLIDWVRRDKTIRDFDIDAIDAGLAKMEADYVAEQQAEEKRKDENDGKQPESAGEPA